MRRAIYQLKNPLRTACCIILLIAACLSMPAQSPTEKCIIKDGKMVIEISKQLSAVALDSFITKFDLFDLDLKQFIKTNSPDSLQKLGWQLEKNNPQFFVISKILKGFQNFNNPAEKMIFTEKKLSTGALFPAVENRIQYGYNSFRKKYPFLVNDSLVTFFLRNNSKAQQVMLAGSFNDWDPTALAMTQTDSGWVATVKLGAGKYWYKFIVDGNWMVDNDNARVENDGRGNDNSVYYKANVVFRLNGFGNAKKVYVSGSFNNWQPRQLPMTRTNTGWQLPVYLAQGTHTYRFVADGKWMSDPENKDLLPNEFNDFNSVIKIGTPYLFKLMGYKDAKQAVLTGSFNNWRQDELLMNKTADGWELPYTLGPGNYEYRYRIDGKWVSTPENPATILSKEQEGNNYLVIQPNYIFRLKGFPNATTVFLAGDFNNWATKSYAMKRDGDDWVKEVHLSQGKHLYKFIVDGKWMKDPGNDLWEQNEFDTGNSVIWFER